tara:strand:+ start:1095 stop:1340 length:246 start_codon:yes stop_codon:yes gene_type:complete
MRLNHVFLDKTAQINLKAYCFFVRSLIIPITTIIVVIITTLATKVVVIGKGFYTSKLLKSFDNRFMFYYKKSFNSNEFLFL